MCGEFIYICIQYGVCVYVLGFIYNFVCACVSIYVYNIVCIYFFLRNRPIIP